MIEKPKEISIYKIIDFIHKHIIGVIIAVVVIACILSSLYVFTGKGKADETSDGVTYEDMSTIYLAMSSVQTLNPLTTQDEDVYYINELLYSSLFSLDDNLNIENDLVDSYTVNTEEGSVDIVLKSGVKFSDDTDLDSADVKYTIGKIKDIGSFSPYYVYASRIKRCSIDSDTKFTIYFNSASDAALDNLVFPIVSNKGYTTDDSYTPVGSGPYVFSSYDSASYLDLAINSNYYGTVAKDSIKFKILPQVSTTTSLMTMDAITAYINESVDGDSDAEDKGLNYTSINSSEAEYLGFNFSNTYLSKQKVRQAIAKAIDTESIVKDNYGGTAISSDSIYFPGFLGTKNSGDAYSLNQSEAVKLLKDEGFKDTNEDGILEDSDGNKIALTILVNSNNTGRVDAANTIADSLKNIGISVTVNSLDWDSYQESLTAGEFDLMLGGYKFDKQYDLRTLFDSSNILHYNNSTVLGYVNKLETAISADDYKTTYQSLKEELKSDLPYYCLCYKTYQFVTAKKFTSEGSPTFFDKYKGIETWTWQRAVTDDTASDTYESDKE